MQFVNIFNVEEIPTFVMAVCAMHNFCVNENGEEAELDFPIINKDEVTTLWYTGRQLEI